MRRIAFLIPLIALALLVGGFGIALLGDYDPEALPSALIDRPAPAFSAAGLAGVDEATLSDADFGDGVRLVNFFASWCTPCLAEHPLLTRLSGELGLTLYGIAYEDEAEDTAAWLARHGNPFDRVARDPDGRVGIEWGISGVPETFVVDAAGRVRFRYAGPLTPEVVEDSLLPVLAALDGR